MIVGRCPVVAVPAGSRCPSGASWYHSGIVTVMALTLRTDDELERALETLAASEGLSRQEVIRRAVLERYERAGHAAKVDDSADRMLRRWGDVLDRLGSA